MSAKTICVTQDGPANALALNKDFTQVVVAGRNVFKVFSIEEEEFVENINLRVGKNLNLNFSCNDVAWSLHEDHVLATAATNGAVVLWSLNRPSRSKQDHVFLDHKRTVNKVSFHPAEPHWLISGSQDGTMKIFDLRVKEATRTFLSNTESVRDVQFSPHSHHMFASVAENGTVQQWDLRRADKCYQQFTAHSGPVFACDWHPENPWLATASRDKTIKVWDLTNKPTLEYTINTIASVGRVRWRPQRKFHLASVALVVDCSVNIWDVRRPYIPFASFNEHKDIATGIAWRGDPHLLLTTSRDCTLYQHAFKDAVRPADKANPAGISFNSNGDIAFACKSQPVNNKTGKMSSILRRAPTTSEEFVQAGSWLHWYNKQQNNEGRWLLGCAQGYQLSGKPLAELCDHNANVARQLGRFSVSLVWSMIKTLYAPKTIADYGHHTPLREEQTVRDSGGGKEDPAPEPAAPPANADETAEPEVGASKGKKAGRKLRLEDLKPGSHSLGDFFFGDGEMDPLSLDFERGNSVGLTVGTFSADWTLPVEAFPLRHEIRDHSPPPEQYPHSDSPEPVEDTQMLPAEEPCTTLLTVNCVMRPTAWEASTAVGDALRHHAARGDVQTSASVLIVLGEKRKALENSVDESTQEHWLLAYIELLSRYKLWNVCTQIIQLSWMPSVMQLNQQSTTVYSACAQCRKPLIRSGWLCDRCHSTSCSVCSVCNKVVRGLYSWCQGCEHGGHLGHLQDWFAENRLCPTGCGHACEFT
ncbi:GATOR complex protein WDR24 isoform X2 [Homalodisca vitripennis]|uniref:GATOR complex protein WDR24 isoform X2 n=1 Tax=Homalodisca vitripennis TaxID=197043 RepID=UPI001EEC42A3|nr:GATOR complex protein WDR24 isoform X2 [Homalodisca vitripennis]